MSMLTPAQERTLGQLRKPEGGLPDFEGVGQTVDEYTRKQAAPLLERWEAAGGGQFRLTKWAMTGCERRRVEDREQFSWSPEKAQGTMVHQMIQCWFFGPDRPPGYLWTLAVDMVQRDNLSIGKWIGTLSAGEWIEMRLRCESLLTQFVEVFPPLGESFRPAVEAKQVWQAGPLTCEGKVDIQLGADDGTKAGTVFVELKTGKFRAEDLAGLRHYALLRAMRVGTPPRTVALFSVAEGRMAVEQITEATLWQAGDRLLAAVEEAVTLQEGRTPSTTPSPLCNWCGVKDRCRPGQVFLAEQDRER